MLSEGLPAVARDGQAGPVAETLIDPLVSRPKQEEFPLVLDRATGPNPLLAMVVAFRRRERRIRQDCPVRFPVNTVLARGVPDIIQVEKVDRPVDIHQPGIMHTDAGRLIEVRSARGGFLFRADISDGDDCRRRA